MTRSEIVSVNHTLRGVEKNGGDFRGSINMHAVSQYDNPLLLTQFTNDLTNYVLLTPLAKN